MLRWKLVEPVEYRQQPAPIAQRLPHRGVAADGGRGRFGHHGVVDCQARQHPAVQILSGRIPRRQRNKHRHWVRLSAVQQAFLPPPEQISYQVEKLYGLACAGLAEDDEPPGRHQVEDSQEIGARAVQARGSGGPATRVGPGPAGGHGRDIRPVLDQVLSSRPPGNRQRPRIICPAYHSHVIQFGTDLIRQSIRDIDQCQLAVPTRIYEKYLHGKIHREDSRGNSDGGHNSLARDQHRGQYPPTEDRADKPDTNPPCWRTHSTPCTPVHSASENCDAEIASQAI